MCAQFWFFVTYSNNSYSANTKMHLSLKLFILLKGSTCFGRPFRPSSGAQDCTYSKRHMSKSCCYLLLSGMRWNVSHIIYSCKTHYMFRTGFPSIIRSSRLHIQQESYVEQLLLLGMRWNASGAQDCTYSKSHMSNSCCYLLLSG